METLDTSFDARSAHLAVFEGLSGAERVAMSVEMAEEAKSLALAGIRFRNPDLLEREVHAEWLGSLYGADFAHVLLSRAV